MLTGRWEEEGGFSPTCIAHASNPRVPAAGTAWGRHSQRAGAVPGLLLPGPPGGCLLCRVVPRRIRPSHGY